MPPNLGSSRVISGTLGEPVGRAVPPVVEAGHLDMQLLAASGLAAGGGGGQRPLVVRHGRLGRQGDMHTGDEESGLGSEAAARAAAAREGGAGEGGGRGEGGGGKACGSVLILNGLHLAHATAGLRARQSPQRRCPTRRAAAGRASSMSSV